MKTGIQKRILVIEDEQIDRQIIEIYLSGEYNLTFADTYDVACNQLNQQSFDLIITDLNIGQQVDGAKVLAYVRSSALNQQTPVIAYSASRKGTHSGFNGYLTKPVAKNDLLNAVLTFLK